MSSSKRQRISVNDIKQNGLPEGATGVVWDDIDSTECRDCVEQVGWAQDIDDDDLAGTVLYGGDAFGHFMSFGYADCDSCLDAVRIEVQALKAVRHNEKPPAVADLPTDLDGWPYTDTGLGPWRVTPCCGAFAEIDNTGVEPGALICKQCYEVLPVLFHDSPPRLETP